jgi:hypothetical protein
MALTSDQIANILFKKIVTGKSTTSTTKEFFEEGASGRPFVDLSQIWTQSNKIPHTAAPVTGIVEFVQDLQLVNVAGTTSAFTHTNLKNVIPFNYGDGSSYMYQVKTSANANIIFGSNGMVLDTETGTLTFFDGLPSGVTAGTPPKISFYKYIGNTAADSGLATGGSTVSMGDWQNSVKQFASVNGDLTSNLGDRFILENSLTLNVYDKTNDTVASEVVPANHIIEYYVNPDDASVFGYLSIEPQNGMFTSVDSLSNSVYFFNGSEWAKYETEKTYPTEKTMMAQDTEAVVSGLPQVASNDVITVAGTPNTDISVFVNGVKLKDTQFIIATLSVEPQATASMAKFDNNGTIVWKSVSGGVVYGSVPAGAATYYLHMPSSFPKAGDYLLVTPQVGYDLEGGEGGDEITVNYVRPTA